MSTGTPQSHRTKGISTRVSEADYQRLLELAGTQPLSEWMRATLLAQLMRVPVEETIVAELLAVRSVVLSTLGRLAPEADVRALVEHADRDKREKAQRALRG